MAYTLSRTLKLRLDSNLTANARYNLERIDALGAVYLVDNQEAVNVRSKDAIHIRPNDASIGGTGSGGTLNISAEGQDLDSVNVYADELTLSGVLQLDDQATSATRALRLKYDSSLNGAVDTAANRTLSVDLEGADRQLILGGNLRTTGGALTATLTADSSVTFPLTGTLATLAGTETLTGKTISASSNTITDITNASISNSAAIAYSKLALTGSIVNADVSGSAAIAYSKLNLSGSILGSDISSSADISYGQLNLTNGILDADINDSADISYSKLNLVGGIVDADISNSAAIAGTKISPTFGAQTVSTSAALRLVGSSYHTDISAAASGQSENLSFTLPPSLGTDGQVLASDGVGGLEWLDVAGTGTVTSVGLSAPDVFSVSGSPVTVSGTLALSLAAQAANEVWAGPTTGSDAAPTFRPLVVADIPSGVDHGGLAGLTDDDHAQYHTDARALTWLGTRSTSDLAEGTNLYWTTSRFNSAFGGKSTTDLAEGTSLYFTDERVDDRVSNLLQSGTGISWSYNDSLGTLTPTVTLSPFSTTNLAEGDNLYHTTARVQTVIDANGYATDWTSGTTKSVTHNLATRDVIVQLYDLTSYETVGVDSVIRTDTNTVDLSASEAPSGSGWRVIITKA